jgi:protein-L-isoaspartate(D-aspartate) O-methyltransferase
MSAVVITFVSFLSFLLLTYTRSCEQARQQRSTDYVAERRAMVDLIRSRGVSNESVLRAMLKVPRHRFVPTDLRDESYGDHPLPIGSGQTISQPYIVAYMTESAEIKKTMRVLEIGTGSGYQAAILGELAKEVYSIEIVPELGEQAKKLLGDLGYSNVEVRIGNGYLGWPEKAPFDAIIVTAAPDEIPKALVEQLGVGGRMVVPVGSSIQEMVIVTKTKDGVTEKRTMGVRFVPMVSKPR